MANQPKKKNIPFTHVLAALLNSQNVFPPTYLHHFSDLEGKDLESLRSAWPEVSALRRFTLLEDLEELAETDTLVSFNNVARMALTDADPRVRTVAVRLLWEDEDPQLGPVFMRMLEEDPSVDVRAAAATALGLFVYQGELEEIPEDIWRGVETVLLKVLNGTDEKLVRRRALEALGFSGRPEVAGKIREAYESRDAEWLASALFAMGRSADNAWAADVLRMMRHPKGSVQLEAVRAAGSLELQGARRALLDLLEEEAQDPEIRLAIIWSLSQIGGDEVRETLEETLEETEDEDEAEFIEKALDNLNFTEDVDIYGMLDLENLNDSMTEESIDPPSLHQLEDSEDVDLPNTQPGDDSDTDAKQRRNRKSS